MMKNRLCAVWWCIAALLVACGTTGQVKETLLEERTVVMSQVPNDDEVLGNDLDVYVQSAVESGIDDKFHGIWTGSLASVTNEEAELERIKLEISSHKIKLYFIDKNLVTISYINEDGERIEEPDPNSKYGEWVEIEPITESINVEGENLVYNWIDTEIRGIFSTETISGIASVILLNQQAMDTMHLWHIQGRRSIQQKYYHGQLIKLVEEPQWVSEEEVQIKDGIIYFHGYTEKSSLGIDRTERNAIIYAQAHIVSYLKENQLSYPIPASARSRRSVYSSIINNDKTISVQATFSDFEIIDRWIDSDEGVHILCSCSGIEWR